MKILNKSVWYMKIDSMQEYVFHRLPNLENIGAVGVGAPKCQGHKLIVVQVRNAQKKLVWRAMPSREIRRFKVGGMNEVWTAPPVSVCVEHEDFDACIALVRMGL